MKFLLPLPGLAFLAGFCFLSLQTSSVLATPPVPETTPPSLEMIATNGGGEEKHLFSHNGVVSQLVVNPNQAVPVTLQFPVDKAGTRVAVGCLDGGEVNGNDLILPTGKLNFTFRGESPGLYRLLVQLPIEQYRLEIYVIDPKHPRNPRQRPSR
jgi:hypothetical protein